MKVIQLSKFEESDSFLVCMNSYYADIFVQAFTQYSLNDFGHLTPFEIRTAEHICSLFKSVVESDT